MIQLFFLHSILTTATPTQAKSALQKSSAVCLSLELLHTFYFFKYDVTPKNYNKKKTSCISMDWFIKKKTINNNKCTAVAYSRMDLAVSLFDVSNTGQDCLTRCG